MKIHFKKRTIYTVLASILLLSCIHINNVKVIVDQHCLLGFELDFSDMEVSLGGKASNNTATDVADSQSDDQALDARP